MEKYYQISKRKMQVQLLDKKDRSGWCRIRFNIIEIHCKYNGTTLYLYRTNMYDYESRLLVNSLWHSHGEFLTVLDKTI